MQARSASGPVAVFDQKHLVAGVSRGLRWSLVHGCELPQTAVTRARGLAACTGTNRTVEGGGFWQAQTEAVSSGAPGWGEVPEPAAHSDPRTRDSIWLDVRHALASLADPWVLDTVTPSSGESFDPATFLR